MAKVSFGGGKKGCLGCVYKNTKFRVEAGVNRMVPATQGAFPIFPANATDNKKKKLITEFIRDENDILVIEAVEELLKTNCSR